MKPIFKILLSCILFLIIFYLWNEVSNFSLYKKINDQKVSSFFTALSSLLTAATIYLIYRQLKEQIEGRKASSKPDLYPESQFFTIRQSRSFPILSRDEKEDVLLGLIPLHNIGKGTAKEILVKWHFDKKVLSPLIDPTLLELYLNRETDRTYSFLPQDKVLEIQLPLMYMASLSAFEKGWSEVIWEDLFLEISYKDIHDFLYPKKIFKVTAYVGAYHARFDFTQTESVILNQQSTIRSPFTNK